MNSNTVNSVIHCAILLCSTAVSPEEKLDIYTHKYLTAKGFTVDPATVTEQIEKYNIGAKLYGRYRNNIGRIQKISMVREIYRFIWIYGVVAELYETLTPARLLSMVNSKFEEEQMQDGDLDRNKFSAFKLIDREFFSKDSMMDTGKALNSFAGDFTKAL